MQTISKSKTNTGTIVHIGVTSALISVCSQISLPLPGGIPVTLQTFAVAFSGFFLGKKDGTASVLVYLILGATGIPIFAGFKGGLSSLIGMTGGFLSGFLLFPLFCGFAAQLKSIIPLIALPLCGLACVHLCGILWLSYMGNISLQTAFFRASAPFIIKDIISIAPAYMIARRLSSLLRQSG